VHVKTPQLMFWSKHLIFFKMIISTLSIIQISSSSKITNAPNHKSKIKAHAHMVRIVWLWHLRAPINIKFASYTLQMNNLSHSCLENKSHCTHNEHCVPTSNVKCRLFVKCMSIKLRAPRFAVWRTWNSFQV